MSFRRLLPLALAALALAPSRPTLAGGEWYEDYEAGKNNCDAGNFGTCAAKMNAAIARKPKSEKSARTYGMNFTDYTPYYYLGLAHFNQGNIPKAVENFNKEADYGVIFKSANSGSFSAMSKQAAATLAAMSKPAEPAPAPKPAEPPPAPKPAEPAPSHKPAEPPPPAPASPKNSPPPTVIIYRSAPVPAPPPVAAAAVPAAAPVTGQGASTLVKGAVKNLLSGDYGTAINGLENPTAQKEYQNNAGYYLLLAYGYYCRSFAQPDRKGDFDPLAKSNVKKAAQLNPNLKPDGKLFPAKFIAFYRDNI